MKAPARRSHSAFTLVELLVVIALIAILAALLLPATIGHGHPRPILQAKMEINMIVTAIAAYEADYNRFPVSSNVTSFAAASNGDFTFGGTALNAALGPGNWTADNAKGMAILLDLENYGSGTPTINKDHVMNPLRTKYVSVNKVNDMISPGVGTDGVYRDPWGSPYIISLDLNRDQKCRDAFYGLKAVSQQTGVTGFDGLANSTDPGGAGDNFEFNGRIMVWSLGPDKTASASQRANAGANKDNVLSWKP